MGLTLNFVLVGMLIVLRNVLVVYFCLFFLGISIAARYYVGYTYNLEFQPKRSHVIVSVVQFSAESIVYLLNIAYFVYISDRWIPLQIPNLILSLVGVIYVYFMPETPVWLVATKKYDSARGVFA
jgi:MFS family permease